MDLDSKTSHKAASTVVLHDALDMHCLTEVKLYKVLSGILVATILISFEVSIIATAIPAISSQFNAATDIGWYGAAYPLTMCALQPLSGKNSSIFSVRWSPVLCSAATKFPMFIVGRAVAGIGGAGIVSGGLSVIAANLAAWCFYINLPTGVVTVGALRLFFFHAPKSTAVIQQDTPIQKTMDLDLIGCIIFVGSIVMVFLALQWEGGEYAWNPATIIGLFVGFAVWMLLFILWQMYKGDAAFILLSILKDRSVALSIIFAFPFMGSFVVSVYYISEWFQIVKGASPMRRRAMLLQSVCTQVFGAIVSGVAIKHVWYYNPWFFIGSSILCIACVDGFQILQSFGRGFAAQMALLTIQNVLKTRPNIIPVEISTVLFAQYFGSSVMQTGDASIFHNKLVDRLESTAGLNATGVAILLEAGHLNVKKTAVEAFPGRFEAISPTITTLLTLLAFVLSTGIKWTNVNHADPEEGAEKQTADDQPEP
ncbi:hypothetical protein BDW67DRAFT_174254 [Aspergillus spinulosporus]